MNSSSRADTGTRIHVLRTNRALTVLVSLQSINRKYAIVVTLTRVTNERVCNWVDLFRSVQLKPVQFARITSVKYDYEVNSNKYYCTCAASNRLAVRVKMRPVATDVARSLRVCVYVLDTSVSPTKTDEQIEIPAGVWTSVGARNHVLPGSPRVRGNFRGCSPTEMHYTVSSKRRSNTGLQTCQQEIAVHGESAASEWTHPRGGDKCGAKRHFVETF